MQRHTIFAALLCLIIFACSNEEDNLTPQLALPPIGFSDFTENQEEVPFDADLDSGELLRYYEIDLKGNILAVSNPENFRNPLITFDTTYYSVDSSLVDRNVLFQPKAGNWIDGKDSFWKFVKVTGEPTRLAMNILRGDYTTINRNFINGGSVVSAPENQFFDRHLSYVFFEFIDQESEVDEGVVVGRRRHLVIYTPINFGQYNVSALDFGHKIDGYAVHRFDLGQE